MDTKQKKSSMPSRRRSGKTPDSGKARRPAAKAGDTRRKTSNTRHTGHVSSASPRRKVSHQPKKATPEVVYTPAQPFSRNRFLLRLLTVAAVVIAVIFGISIFFKVETVMVSGAEKYTAWEIREASGIEDGENLLTFSRARASGKITTALPYVKSARIGIKLPDTVIIEVVELDVVYAVKADDGTSWLMTSDGRIVEQTTASAAVSYTNVLGVQLESPEKGAQARASRITPGNGETAPEGETGMPVTAVSPDQQLETALTILQYLEANNIIGQAASVDVTDLSDLELWYGQQYQVKLGDASQLSRKIKDMKAVIDQMEDYQHGVLDITYGIWKDQVGYTPF